MKKFQIFPAVLEYDSFGEFVRDFDLKETDLIFTSRHAYTPVIADCGAPCRVLFRDDFGGGEPTDTMVNAILAAAHTAPFDRVIAVGGGSILDIAKIIAVADGTSDVNDLYARVDRLQRTHGLIALPTTCGTGSEVTNIAIVNRTALGTKHGLVSDVLYADAAVLVPDFTASMPYQVFATSSIDALIHGIESYLSPLAGEYSEIFSESAIRSILNGYQKVAVDKTALPSWSAQFLSAATRAGIGFGNAGCGTIHAMSFAFGGKYHVPHGEACYQFLMPVLHFYKENSSGGKLARLDALIGEILGADDGFAALADILEKILPAKPMRDYGADATDPAAFAASTVANQQRLLARSYVPLTERDIRGIYETCLEK
ncbi:MAG: iron-containing alcohol dehydrogenase [Clostridia bacterium]|nr:iron-containing alcohol dehydrogenase [Clostridia bacterium]